MLSDTEIKIYESDITIKFPEIPAASVRNDLIANGFLWLPSEKLWSAKATIERKTFAQWVSTHSPKNKIFEGDCIDIMNGLPAQSVDLIVTDPPYLVNYKDRLGRSIRNDIDDKWVEPAFAAMFRVLKGDSYCVSFCGWNSIGIFINAAKESGFKPAAQIVWQKEYASSSNYIACHHEQAIVLTKGRPKKPSQPLKSVLPWSYSGNKLHPTQKHVDVISPLIEAFSQQGCVVLDPFCGSGTTLISAHKTKRSYIGIELDPDFFNIAKQRLLDG